MNLQVSHFIPRIFFADILHWSEYGAAKAICRKNSNTDIWRKISKMISRKLPLIAIAAAMMLAATAFAQTDPGVQGGTRCSTANPKVCTGTAVASVQNDTTGGVIAFFNDGLSRFQDVESVNNSPTGNNGLGPRFNLNQCSGCHSQPSIRGSSPASNLEFQVIANGVVSGSTNSIPSFLSSNGPTREARFPFFFNSNGSPNTNAPNGGVEDLFTVSGRSDAGNCSLPQPSFSTAQQTNNIIFRIPTPVFGAGLIENIDDSTLLANHSAQASNNFGIGGTFNHNGNDGTIARFGWKAQNKSLVLFSGEAYNVEMGISNEIFGQDRPLPGEDQLGSGLPSSCLNLSGTGYPEDITNFSPTVSSSDSFAQNASINSDVVAFAEFMRMLAPPIPSSTTPGGATSISNGRALFNSI